MFCRTLLFSALLATTAAAQTDIAQISLLPGWRDGNRHVAALRIEMDPGWKTYWRTPGDAGIPPYFDWTGSGNLNSVRIFWPVPTVFDQNGLTTVGYKDAVVIPVELTARDAGKPIRVNLAANIGVCEDICVPYNAVVTGDLSAAVDVRQDARIRAALINRPLSQKEAGVGAVRCKISATDDGVRLTADIAMPQAGANEYAIVELADPTMWVSQSRTIRSGGQLQTTVDIVPPRGAAVAVNRSAVRFTILSAADAVDIRGCS